MANPALQTWQCYGLGCGARNLEVDTACAQCHRERPRKSMFREALETRPLPPVDVEEFLRRNLARRRYRLQAEALEIDGAVYLTLGVDGGEGRVWRVDENELTPCDSHGRASW